MHTVRQSLLHMLRLESNGVPIYVQLRDQMLRGLGSGALAPGEQMPTMREVAVALRIDLNTVRHAYDELERIGAINLVRGRGSFVAEPPPASDPDDENERVDALARQTLASATAMGIDPQMLAQRIATLAQQRPGQPKLGQPMERKP